MITLNKGIKYFQERLNVVLLMNYLMVLYAFFILIDYHIAQSLIFAIVILFFFSGNIKDKIIYTFQDKVIQALLLLFIVHIICLTFTTTNNMYIAIDKIKSVKLLLYSIIFVATTKKEFIPIILSAFIYSVFIGEIASYSIFFHLIPPFNNATLNNPVPFTPGHTVYTIFLVISLGIIFYKILYNQFTNRLIKLIHIFFFFTISFNIFLIASRLGYILFFTTLVTVILYINRKHIFRSLFLVLTLTSILYSIAYFSIDTFHTRVNQMIDSTEKVLSSKDFSTSFGVRLGVDYYSLEIIKEYPILGLGTGNHMSAMEQVILNSPDQNNSSLLAIFHTGAGGGLHNEYLSFIIQFGLVGLILYLNLYYQLIKYKQENKYIRAIQILLVSIFSVNALVSSMVYFGTLTALFIILISLTLNPYDSHEKTKKSNAI